MQPFFVIIICFISAFQTAQKNTDYYFPPEWEPQESIWLGWSLDPGIQQVQDENVRDILQQQFPGYTLVQINPLGLNRNGGGMHCATQQHPK